MDDERKPLCVTDIRENTTMSKAAVEFPVDQIAGLPRFRGFSGRFGRQFFPESSQKRQVIARPAMVNIRVGMFQAISLRITLEVTGHILVDEFLQVVSCMAQRPNNHVGTRTTI